jgi:hypothetical protein
LADKSRTKSCPNLSDIAIQYELLINYKKDHAPFADPIFELNLRPNMPMAELENVLKTYRLFYRDNLGRYQFHPLVEVW